MCGRFVSTSPPDELAAYFGAESVAEAVLEPNHNVAPTQDVLAVVEADGGRYLDAFFWGLVPSWAKDVKIGSKMINARAETLAAKSAFKRSFATRRCIVPADGFYEWKKVGGGAKPKKQPMFIRRTDGEPLAFAGLWSVWRGPDEGPGAAPVAHHHHHVAERAHGHDPRPHAGDPPGGAVGHLARSLQRGPRRRSAGCWSRCRTASSRRRRCRPW